MNAIPPPGAIRVMQDPYIPLTRTLEDGTVEQVLCWQMNGVLLVHPDRWELFQHLARTRLP